ncbi:radical SAM protein [Pseudomonas putida]|uniref:radical SAM protein n=1 Tax=Pseudomonas putida TaxID=303 RepID=UPI002363BA21|nr:radical SAM protein [Pseudomonas putida]MDD2139580.1 radical SAM protein [Pseudomonas putida]HDS1721503.1 radical SAM protein [Pseudomonas putida]
MHNALDMLNVCIAPTRLCNLRCDHCYITPELLSDKRMMAEDVYRTTFDRIEELFKADRKVSKINIELLGGELTMMPLEFWERNLPWTLERMAAWDALYDAEAALIWCTNLIFKDDGYVDLLNRMGQRFGYGLDLFVPWEPDTNRFKKDYKLLPRYLKTLESIHGIKRKTLCITMSRAVVEQGPQFIVDTFISKGITDVTCDMLYPAGSGKAYFQRNCTYGQVSDYIITLRDLLPDYVELSPLIEMESACRTLTHYHYPGNDTYDIEVEPSGEVTFNSSYTGDESSFATQALTVRDEAFAAKTVFNNTPELRLRHGMPYEACNACEFAVVCSGGWAWHKQLDAQMAGMISHGDCAGLKRVWVLAKARMGITQADRSQYLTMVERRLRRGSVEVRKLESAIARGSDTILLESSYADDYDGYFNQLARPRLVEMQAGALHGKSWTERLFFYDAIGSHVLISAGWLSRAAAECGEELFRHIVYRNYHYLLFPAALVATELQRHAWGLTAAVMEMLARLRVGNGIRDDHGRHDELVEFAYRLLEDEQRLEASNAG